MLRPGPCPSPDPDFIHSESRFCSGPAPDFESGSGIYQPRPGL